MAVKRETNAMTQKHYDALEKIASGRLDLEEQRVALSERAQAAIEGDRQVKNEIARIRAENTGADGKLRPLTENSAVGIHVRIQRAREELLTAQTAKRNRTPLEGHRKYDTESNLWWDSIINLKKDNITDWNRILDDGGILVSRQVPLKSGATPGNITDADVKGALAGGADPQAMVKRMIEKGWSKQQAEAKVSYWKTRVK